MANIALAFALCYIYLSLDPHQELYTFLQSGSALSVLLNFKLMESVLLNFKLKDVLTECIPLKFNTFNE